MCCMCLLKLFVIYKSGVCMKDLKQAIYILTTVVVIMVYPIGVLVGIFDLKTAVSTIFILLGCQQLFKGFYLAAKDNKILRSSSFIIGGFFLLSGFWVIFRTYSP